MYEIEKFSEHLLRFFGGVEVPLASFTSPFSIHLILWSQEDPMRFHGTWFGNTRSQRPPSHMRYLCMSLSGPVFSSPKPPTRSLCFPGTDASVSHL